MPRIAQWYLLTTTQRFSGNELESRRKWLVDNILFLHLTITKCIVFGPKKITKFQIQYNTVVSNQVYSDHVLSFSCLDVWNVRLMISGVYAITVTTSTYYSRRCGRLNVIEIWRHQGNCWIHYGVHYTTICLLSENKGRSFSWWWQQQIKKENKFNFKEVIVSTLKSLINIM